MILVPSIGDPTRPPYEDKFVCQLDSLPGDYIQEIRWTYHFGIGMYLDVSSIRSYSEGCHLSLPENHYPMGHSCIGIVPAAIVERWTSQEAVLHVAIVQGDDQTAQNPVLSA